MTATTWPGCTVAPGETARVATVPAAGAVSVATALAVMVAEESTISVTSLRAALPTLTAPDDPVHAATPKLTSAAVTPTNAARGARRMSTIVTRRPGRPTAGRPGRTVPASPAASRRRASPRPSR